MSREHGTSMSTPPSDDEIKRLHRWFAMRCNDRSWTLSEQSTRTEEDDDELLSTAHTSAFHWRAVGSDVQRAQADLLLSQVHALLGQPDLATRYADRAYAFFSSHESQPWVLAFAEAIKAHAAAVAGREGEHAAHYARAIAIGGSLGDEDRKLFMATFDRVPAPRPDR